MRRPTFLDIAKASLSLGVCGELACSAAGCKQRWVWRFEPDRDSSGRMVAPGMNADERRWAQTGFFGRILQEIIQHCAEAHPEAESPDQTLCVTAPEGVTTEAVGVMLRAKIPSLDVLGGRR